MPEPRFIRTPLQRLRQRADFVAAAAAGTKTAGSGFMLQARNRRDEGPARVGFTVSKRVGTAVERNRVRRRLKQVVNRVAPNGICLGHDYVLVGRREALSLPFDRLAEEIGQAFARVSSVARGAPTRRGTRKSSR